MQKLLCQTPDRINLKLKTDLITVVHCGANTKNHQILLEAKKMKATDEYLW